MLPVTDFPLVMDEVAEHIQLFDDDDEFYLKKGKDANFLISKQWIKECLTKMGMQSNYTRQLYISAKG